MFQPQQEFFSRHYQVIIPDLRGNGQSGELACHPDTVLDQQTHDIIELIDHLGLSEVVVVGVSYGGVVSMHLLARYRGRISAAVLCDTFSSTVQHPVLNCLVKLMLPLSKIGWLMDLATTGFYKRWPLASAYFHRLFCHLRGNEVVLQRKAILSIDYRAELRQVTQPVLCLAGKSARGSSLVKMMRTTEAQLAHCSSFVIKNSFDPSNLCQPERFNQLVDQFLRQHYID